MGYALIVITILFIVYFVVSEKMKHKWNEKVELEEKTKKEEDEEKRMWKEEHKYVAPETCITSLNFVSSYHNKKT